MQIWAESGKSALPICNYSQILYQFLTFTQNLKRSQHLESNPIQIVMIDGLFLIMNYLRRQYIIVVRQAKMLVKSYVQ